MADCIEWKVTISNVDVKAQRADITAVRHNTVTGDAKSFSYTGVIITEVKDRDKVLDAIKATIEADDKWSQEVAALIKGRDLELAKALDAWEVERG